MLIRKVALAPTDPDTLASHPTMRAFSWFAEDVPDKTWVPVVDRIAKPQPEHLGPADWFGGRD